MDVVSLRSKADLSNRTEIDRLVSAAFGHFGSIDILVNNAGVEKKAPFWAVTEEGGDSRFERPAGRVMAVGNTPRCRRCGRFGAF